MRHKEAQPTTRPYPNPLVPILEQRANRIAGETVARCVVLNLSVRAPAVESGLFSPDPYRCLAIYQQCKRPLFIGFSHIHPVELRARWRAPLQPEEPPPRGAPNGAFAVLR